MQKNNKNASILIWTIFLSVVISITFLGISTKIHKNIKNSGDFIDTIDTQTQITNYIASGSLSKTYNDTSFGDNIRVTFEDNTNITRGIKAGEISQFNSYIANNQLNIQNTSGGVIYYEVRENASSSSGTITSNSSRSIVLNNTGSIYIESLGGYNSINIASSKGIFPQYTYYTIWRKIGNRETIQARDKISNF